MFHAERVAALTVLVGGLCLVMSPLRSAKLGEIDDHQYVAMVGHGSRLAFSRMPGLIWHALTTFGGRFHPFFDVLLVLEVALAGVDAHAWYALRALIAFSSLIALYLLARQAIRPLSAAVVALMLLAGPQSQTWVRLGPLEGEATVALLFGALCLVRWYRERQARFLYVGFSLVWLAALTKESFSPYALMALGLVVLLTVSERGAGAQNLAAIVVLTFLALVPIVGVIVTYAVSGDPYAGHRTISGVVDAASTILADTNGVSGWLFISGFACVYVYSQYIATRRLAPVRRYAVAVMAAMVMWLVPQAIVYSTGAIGGRYLIPAVFLSICVIVSSLWLIEHQPPAGIFQRVCALLITAVLFVVMIPALLHARQHARSYADASVRFQQELNLLFTLQRNNPSFILVFESNDAFFDYEPIMSVKRYVDWKTRRSVPAILSFKGDQGVSQFVAELQDSLSAISHNGNRLFLRESGMSPGQECIGVQFHVAAPAPCRYSVSFGNPPAPD